MLVAVSPYNLEKKRILLISFTYGACMVNQCGTCASTDKVAPIVFLMCEMKYSNIFLTWVRVKPQKKKDNKNNRKKKQKRTIARICEGVLLDGKERAFGLVKRRDLMSCRAAYFLFLNALESLAR